MNSRLGRVNLTDAHEGYFQQACPASESSSSSHPISPYYGRVPCARETAVRSGYHFDESTSFKADSLKLAPVSDINGQPNLRRDLIAALMRRSSLIDGTADRMLLSTPDFTCLLNTEAPTYDRIKVNDSARVRDAAVPHSGRSSIYPNDSMDPMRLSLPGKLSPSYSRSTMRDAGLEPALGVSEFRAHSIPLMPSAKSSSALEFADDLWAAAMAFSFRRNPSTNQMSPPSNISRHVADPSSCRNNWSQLSPLPDWTRSPLESDALGPADVSGGSLTSNVKTLNHAKATSFSGFVSGPDTLLTVDNCRNGEKRKTIGGVAALPSSTRKKIDMHRSGGGGIKNKSAVEKQRRERISLALIKLREAYHGDGDTASMIVGAANYMTKLKHRVSTLEATLQLHGLKPMI